VDISRVVIEGSRGLGMSVERQDDGSRTDFKNLRESCSRRSARLKMYVSLIMLNYRRYFALQPSAISGYVDYRRMPYMSFFNPYY